jgi:hypothetical protein
LERIEKANHHHFVATVCQSAWNSFSLLRRFAGHVLTKDDLIATSVPSSLVQFLVQRNTAPFDAFSRLPLFCLSDEDCPCDCDCDCDCDFAYSYFALDAMLRYLGRPEITMDDADDLKEFVRNVQSVTVRRGLVINMFSLIFLQDGGPYLCTIQTADLVLTSLLSMAKDQELIAYRRAGALQLQLQLAKMFASGDSFEQALPHRDSLLLSSLEWSD